MAYTAESKMPAIQEITAVPKYSRAIVRQTNLSPFHFLVLNAGLASLVRVTALFQAVDFSTIIIDLITKSIESIN